MHSRCRQDQTIWNTKKNEAVKGQKTAVIHYIRESQQFLYGEVKNFQLSFSCSTGKIGSCEKRQVSSLVQVAQRNEFS